MVQRLFLLFVLWMLSSFSVATWAGDGVDVGATLADQFLQVSQKILSNLSEEREQGELGEDRALQVIQNDISPNINFKQLTKRAVGKYWKRTNNQQREQIGENFQKLLEKTYAKLLLRYKGKQVDFNLIETKRLPRGDISLLFNISDGEKEADIDYIFSHGRGDGKENELCASDYKISDIKVEGISLVSSYRRQFSSIIRKQGIDGLVMRLEELAK